MSCCVKIKIELVRKTRLKRDIKNSSINFFLLLLWAKVVMFKEYGMLFKTE